MYVPAPFEERDLTILHALMRAHPLGAWVVAADASLTVNHIPFIVDASRGSLGTLVGHVARANGVWKTAATSSVVIFQGPELYITPSWYPLKQETGKVVPTWNYAVVHAHGVPRFIDDRDWLRSHVTSLTNVHESGREAPWAVTDAPADWIETLLGAIVGVELPIDRLEGKWKASQNRSDADRLGVAAGLEESGDDASRSMAGIVRAAMNRPR